jgi:hypothetical protein
MAQMGLNYGRDLVRGSLAQYMPGAATLWGSLRYYFDVNNAYVLRKLLALLFPFSKRRWARLSAAEAAGTGRHAGDAGGAGAAPAPPAHDENAPDLYIPTMAFITFVLVAGLVKGVGDAFHPDVLVAAASAALAAAALEVFLVRAALYTFAADAAVPLLDLAALAGYKFPGLVVNALAGLALGRAGYYAALAYTAAAAAFFAANTLRAAVAPPDAVLAPRAGSAQSVLLFAGAIQVALMWWLGRAP